MAEVEDRTSKGGQKRASVPLLAIENTPTETKKRKEDEGNEKKSENYKVEEQDQKLEEKKEKEEEKPAEDKPAIAVNADLEKALEARDKSKNEKIGGDASSTKDPKSEGMKKPASSMKKPASSQTNFKRPAASSHTGTKGPIPSEKLRKKMKPDGCSKCRHVAGCTASCWAQRGYHR